MGNEFGHPEWIDFPREGNGWSHKYARRQWGLFDNKNLCYHYLGDFDSAMVHLIESVKNIQETPVIEVWHNAGDQVLAYRLMTVYVISLISTLFIRRIKRNG